MTRPLCAQVLLIVASACLARAGPSSVSGCLTDMSAHPVPGASVRLRPLKGGAPYTASTGPSGCFLFPSVVPGDYRIAASAPGFLDAARTIHFTLGPLSADLRFPALAPRAESLTVSASVRDIGVESPDPSVKVFSSAALLDANPGRPGAPISIPGYPIETASGGVKAPQYFAPGVAGDHGEPIAQYVQIGSFLLPNNLSANAHGNGYADPNIFIAGVVEAVQVDGGAFNVREGNHALNLGTTYSLRSRLDPFFTLTGDQRDITATGGFSPSARSWAAAELSYGNGFLDRLEHRKQFKLNGGRVFRNDIHTLTLFADAYYGFSFVPGLRPIFGLNPVDAANGWTVFPDTIDPRQKDQTHTALLALNDVWKLSPASELQLSGFFRTYNLSLFSDFGDGLIRQSEFRTVTGGSLAYKATPSKFFTLLAGSDYQREAPRHDDLDHFNFFNPLDPNYYGPFTRIDANNITITPVSPYIAAEGGLGRVRRFYLGWRRDEIFLDNQDLLTPANSWSKLAGVNSPKATLTYVPPDSWWLPELALSFGKSFFTEDPRIGAAAGLPLSSALVVLHPVETARSFQLVASRTLRSTELRLTLGHETQSAELGKLDPDTGLPFNLGPGRIRYLAATLRHNFASGSVQATFEQADARDLLSGQVVPEAPRLIGDLTATWQRLPFRLQAKGEFEYVGTRSVGNGCNANAPADLNSYCLGVPIKELRFALSRAFFGERFVAGLNAMLAAGFTGQTTEPFALNYLPGAAGPLPVPENPVAEIVGVRIPSYASLSVTYRFGR